jgi:hypothetical protein
LRLLALVALVLVVAACDPGSPQPSPSPSKSPAPNPADTRAGDLRTHLDLLLGEQVMIVAKQAVAASSHTEDYESYTTLLANNTSELTDLWRSAFGATSAARLGASWDTQNTYLVDYTIGIVTHDDAKSKAALANLTQKFVPQFSGLVSDASRLPLDPATQLLSQQVLEDKAFIDDYADPGNTQKLATFYGDLHRAYAQSARFGDALAVEIAHRYPDKFPGDPELRAVNVRVSANTLLQERSYLETMATAALLAKRPDEAVAFDALTTNSSAVTTVFAAAVGDTPGAMASALSEELRELLNYTKAGSPQKTALTEAMARFANLAGASRVHATDHANALLKTVDDQKAKSFSAIANDDRAAATSVQPIADALRG